MLITVDNQTATRLLRIYGINTPVSDERLPAQRNADAGIPVTIDGVVDAHSGPSMRLKISGRRSSRACPVTEFQAETLVAEFRAENLLPADTKPDRTLSDLTLTAAARIPGGGLTPCASARSLALTGWSSCSGLLRTFPLSCSNFVSASLGSLPLT